MKESDEPSIFLRLVNRYISVWIWSILFGLSASVSFSVANVRNVGRFGTGGFAIAAIYFIAAALVVLAWTYLLRYLRSFIIPLIFSSSDFSEDYARPDAFYDLIRALSAIIFSFVLLFAASFGEAALETILRFR